MTTLSDKAFAIMAVCEETKQPFGITVDYISPRKYKFVWAFKIDKDKARREGYDDNKGSVRKAGCNPCYNRVKTLSLPHEAMASITNRIP
ncbi:hypothetical protein [Marseilla massiliensis]|uniref:hypothetical protein n=1 Tax=Marseilla massiliensis TaxID=1841864 RepID=UPI0030C8C83D